MFQRNRPFTEMLSYIKIGWTFNVPTRMCLSAGNDLSRYDWMSKEVFGVYWTLSEFYAYTDSWCFRKKKINNSHQQAKMLTINNQSIK